MDEIRHQVTGIIDIGSNTVRLSVYQLGENGAYRVVDQGRWAARLSQRMGSDGTLPDEVVNELAEVLRHYGRICEKHGASRVRAVATAAIRQAANRDDVIRQLQEATGITVDILSGEDEARIGSAAVLNSLTVANGFVIDIGGGSTEVTLIRDRKVVSAVSFPIGCVNTSARHHLGGGPVPRGKLADIQIEVKQLLDGETWITEHPGLPLIGLGGTVRAIAKLRQRESGYPFPLLHGYGLAAEEIDATLNDLSALSLEQRRKKPGLSKDRGDVIVPGLAILLGVIQQTRCSGLVVSGTGLRDGLFYETCLPHLRLAFGEDVLEESIRNLNALYPTAPHGHLEQVRRLAVSMYDRLRSEADFPEGSRRLLDAAARLFRIGAVVDYNDCAEHTFYMLMHTHWNGLSHREMIITAAIASYTGANALRRKLAPYRPMLREGDAEAIAKLGTLLQLACALDRSESQAISSLELRIKGSKLQLIAQADHSLPVETTEIESMAKEFKKNWGTTPELHVRASHSPSLH
jgi:exopolyphosphatase/guanosine-5'-triphosphate,3'-diphosphate pyrophosphatase